jgi:hypothetical protein
VPSAVYEISVKSALVICVSKNYPYEALNAVAVPVPPPPSPPLPFDLKTLLASAVPSAAINDPNQEDAPAVKRSPSASVSTAAAPPSPASLINPFKKSTAYSDK